MVVTGVAEQLQNRIAAIVYLDVFMPADAQSLYDLNHAPPPPPTERVSPPRPAAYFHVNPTDSAWVDSKLTPHPMQCFTEKLKVTGAYQAIPKKIYIRAPLFKSAAFDAALAQCQIDHSWKTATVTCGHDVMIDQPAELTAILEKLAQPHYLEASFRGRPPSDPLARAAATLALVRALPPSAPSRAAIHFREPRKPSRIAGT